MTRSSLTAGTWPERTVMLDHIPPTTFWPLFLLFWLVAGFLVAWAFGSLVRWVDNPRNRYINRDPHTERKCRVTRNGFKTRAGIR